MAQLPGGRLLIQQVDGTVVIFDSYTDETYLTFDPSSGDACAKAQKLIHDDPRMDDEQKCFAHFWSGYFYANAC